MNTFSASVPIDSVTTPIPFAFTTGNVGTSPIISSAATTANINNMTTALPAVSGVVIGTASTLAVPHNDFGAARIEIE
ncbi:unnamed protein product [Echinostoma caproni]|uniref:Exosporium leader peptide n=1 Tax=Echinostoma caproni TaxID=27848 RepID=A0A183B264_9TREM|nr:unnamed protein product [Echinostoma caproni]